MIVQRWSGQCVASSVSAPNLLIPMWAILFGALGWNFLEYGFTTEGGLVWGWIVCGVVFGRWRHRRSTPWPWVSRPPCRRPTARPASQSPSKWWLLYPLLAGSEPFSA